MNEQELNSQIIAKDFMDELSDEALDRADAASSSYQTVVGASGLGCQAL